MNQSMKMSRHPIVKWAQRSDILFVTVELPDAKNVKLNLDPEGKFSFSATSGADSVPYEVVLDLYDQVDVNESKASVTSRHVCYLVKKAEEKWWSRLIKQEGKAPVFLKVDWDKWVDEDEQDESGAGYEDGDIDFSNLNLGGDGGFDGEDDESDTEEEEPLEDVDEDEDEKQEIETTNKGVEVASNGGEATVKA